MRITLIINKYILNRGGWARKCSPDPPDARRLDASFDMPCRAGTQAKSDGKICRRSNANGAVFAIDHRSSRGLRMAFAHKVALDAWNSRKNIHGK